MNVKLAHSRRVWARVPWSRATSALGLGVGKKMMFWIPSKFRSSLEHWVPLIWVLPVLWRSQVWRLCASATSFSDSASIGHWACLFLHARGSYHHEVVPSTSTLPKLRCGRFIGRLVRVGWMATSEYRLLYVFLLSLFLWPIHLYLPLTNSCYKIGNIALADVLYNTIVFDILPSTHIISQPVLVASPEC